MNSRPLLLTALLAALPAGAAFAADARAPGTKPNVLFIAVDDLRTSLGCYGDPLAKSPSIDRLAQESRMFSRAYTHQAVCGPARTAILTGRLPDHNRSWHNRNLFRDTNPDSVTLPQLFKNSGYHTESMGKIFSGDERELGGYTGMPKDERLNAEQTRMLRHGYYACVSYTDAQIGKLLAALKRLELERNTIVVLWGDHGYALGDAGRWCKGTNWDLDTRVPLLMRVPGMAQPGTATQAIVEYVDVYPTLAELAGLSAPPYLAGGSLVPMLLDPARRGREFAFSQFSRPFRAEAPEAMGYTIRTDTHRYTRWVEWPARKTIAEELYDYTAARSTEPRWTAFVERKNVIDDPSLAPVLEGLRGKMNQILRERSVVAAVRPPVEGEAAAPKKKKKRHGE